MPRGVYQTQRFSYTPHNTSHGSSPTEPTHIDTEIPSEKIYTGSCHCTAVRLSVETKPLPEIEVKEDNCSICQRVCITFHLIALVVLYPD